ncbi:MAG TPA: hypothetical protein DIT99_23800 [Candidatus Latescibacteria bacterium]|nr:hypothetical protein [Candidatus Latescibacterota bacterium]
MKPWLNLLRAQDETLVSLFHEIFQARAVRLIPANVVLWEKAAHLRATSSTLKAPEALHAATALEHQCDLFITNDSVFQRIPVLPVTRLSDILT